jgi:hypothetical protein
MQITAIRKLDEVDYESRCLNVYGYCTLLTKKRRHPAAQEKRRKKKNPLCDHSFLSPCYSNLWKMSDLFHLRVFGIKGRFSLRPLFLDLDLPRELAAHLT